MDIDLVERATLCIKIIRAMMPEADDHLVDDLSICLSNVSSSEGITNDVRSYLSTQRSKNIEGSYMSPLEAFKRAMFFISSVCSSKTLNQPGAVINRLSEKERAALKNLKSTDVDGFTTERIDDIQYYGTDEYYQNKEFVKDKLEFDKKILK
jgi:hypothetical protein